MHACTGPHQFNPSICDVLRSTTQTESLQWVMLWSGGRGTWWEPRLHMWACSAASRTWTLTTLTTPATQEVSLSCCLCPAMLNPFYNSCYRRSDSVFFLLDPCGGGGWLNYIWIWWAHFCLLRYREAGGRGPLGAGDPSLHGQRVTGRRLHLPWRCQARLKCVTSLWTRGTLLRSGLCNKAQLWWPLLTLGVVRRIQEAATSVLAERLTEFLSAWGSFKCPCEVMVFPLKIACAP